MDINGTEQRQFLGKTPLFWGIVSIIAMAAFGAVLVCGLVFGVGALSAWQLLQTEAQAAQIDGAGSASDVEVETTQVEQVEDKSAAAAEAKLETEPAEAEAGILGIHPDTAMPPKVGNRVTDFTLKDLQGNLVTLSDFAGQPVLINFWATWCGPCEAEMPDINEAYLNHRDQGLVVLAVNLEEHPDTVKSFVDYYQLDFLILLDRKEDVGFQYGARALPTTYFIDPDGIITYVFYGQMDEQDIALGLSKILPQGDE